MISKFFFKIKLIPQKDIRVLLLSIAFSALLFLALTPLHVASNDINAGNLLFSWIAVIISGTALIGSIYFLLRQQDNLTIVNVRPCAVITANSEYVIQELHIEIKSLRDQIYLNKVFVSDPFSPFCTLFKIKTKNPTLIKRKKRDNFCGQIEKLSTAIYSLGEAVSLNLFMRFPKDNREHFLTFCFSDGSQETIYILCR